MIHFPFKHLPAMKYYFFKVVSISRNIDFLATNILVLFIDRCATLYLWLSSFFTIDQKVHLKINEKINLRRKTTGMRRKKTAQNKIGRGINLFSSPPFA